MAGDCGLGIYGRSQDGQRRCAFAAQRFGGLHDAATRRPARDFGGAGGFASGLRCLALEYVLVHRIERIGFC